MIALTGVPPLTWELKAPRLAWRSYYLYRRFAAGRRNPAVAMMLAHRDAFYFGAWKEAATHVGARFEDLGNNFLRLSRGPASTVVNRNFNPFDNQCAVLISGDKPVTYRLLARSGIPVPRHAVFPADGEVPAVPVPDCATIVVKPAAETGGGDGVSTGIGDSRALRKAVAWAGAYSRDVLVEEQIQGDTIRLLYLDGELLDCVRRCSPRLVGDGRRSVRALVQAENERRLHARFTRSQTLLRIDGEMRRSLAEQGLALHSVPPEGSVFMAKRVANENTSGENESLKGMVCDALVAQGRLAAATLGLRLAGIDVVTTDVSQPLERTGGKIIDVNAEPGFYYHYHKNGEPVPVASFILNRILDHA